MQLPFGLLFGEGELDAIRAKAETEWGRKLAGPLREGADEVATREVGEVGPSLAGPAGNAALLAFTGLLWGVEEHLQAAKRWSMAVAEYDPWLCRDPLRLGMTAGWMALALDWGWEAYSDEEAVRVLDALVACAIENGDPAAPVNARRDEPNTYRPRSLVDYLDYNVHHPFHRWAHSTNNWDVVIGGGLMLGSAAVEAAATKLGLALGGSRDPGFELDAGRFDRWYDIAKQRFMNFTTRCYSNSGQYCEGPGGYYTYGTENCLKGLEAARRLRGEDLYSVGLRNSPKWHRELYPWSVADGALNLSDSSMPAHPGHHVIARLAAENRSGWMQGLFLELVDIEGAAGGHRGGMRAALSLVWADAELEPEGYDEPRKFFDFDETGDVVVRTGRDRRADVHLVFRCGKWNAAHTHMDRGNVILSAFGERLLVDAGKMNNYGHEAHKTYHTRTVGHNCVLVGSLDAVGERGKAGGGGSGQHGYNDHPTHGRILRAVSDAAGRATVVGDASHCYARAAVALRALHFRPEGFAVVWDMVEAPGVEEFWTLWHVDNRDGEASVDDAGGAVTLGRPEARLVIVPALAPAAVEERAGWIDAQEGASLYAALSRPDGRFLSLLVPLKAGEELELGSGGEGRATFTLRGAAHSLEWSDDPPGFRLDGEEFDFSRELDGLPG